MGTLIVVEGDPVTGTDTHPVTGTFPNGNPYTGTGDFTYTGSMTGGLSDFVTIDGVPVALLTSTSALELGEDTPAGGHGGPSGTNFQPPGVSPASVTITGQIGTGNPGAGAGSGLLTVGGVKVLLDGDPLDTCGSTPTPGGSTVSADGQSYVGCTE